MKKSIIVLALSLLSTTSWSQGINPITPPTNWLIQVLDPINANPSNLYTTPALLGGDLTNLTVTAGALANGASAFTLTATQPASPAGTQNAVVWTITSAGSASQPNDAFSLTYGAGYTGSSTSRGMLLLNSAAGTGSTINPTNNNNPTGNMGLNSIASATTTGLNFGVVGAAGNGNTSVGVAGFAQTNKNSGVNIGVMGTAANQGSSPVIVGIWASLNQSTAPAVSAALIADNGAQAAPIAIFANNTSTVATINQTGGITATLTSASGTSTVCNTAGTSTLLTLVASGTACGSSAMRFKDAYPAEALNLAGLDALRTDVPWSYRKDSGIYENGRIHVGLIADDVEAMDSRCVVYDKEDKLLNYYDRCVLTYLVADRKELKARITALEEKIH